MNNPFQPLKEAASPLERVNLMGPTVRGFSVDFYCCRADCPDNWWVKRLEHLPDQQAYVGSVWGIESSQHFAVNTRAEMLAEIKPPQYTIHNRPEDIAWVQEKARSLFERAGLNLLPIQPVHAPVATAWTEEVRVDLSKLYRTGGCVVYHAERYDLDVSRVLPCPFCGGQDLVLLGPNFGSVLYCRRCLAQTPCIDPPPALLDFWNTRKPGQKGCCHFCGSENHTTVSSRDQHKNVEKCDNCGAYGPPSLHFSNGAVIEARWLWLAEDGVVTVPPRKEVNDVPPEWLGLARTAL